MIDDRKKWEEWLKQGEQEYKPARRVRSHHAIYGIGGGVMSIAFHAILALIPQSAWRRFGWQRAVVSIAALLTIGIIATGMDSWHLGIIEQNNYYSWGISDAYPAKYETVSFHPLFGTFSFPSEKVMYVIPSDALAHRIFSGVAMFCFWAAGFGTLLVIWLFWKYPDAFAEGDFRDDEASFGPDLSYRDFDTEQERHQSKPSGPPASTPPTGYTGFGRASGGPKTIEAPRNRSL